MPEKERLQGIIIGGGWGFRPALGSSRSNGNQRKNFHCGIGVCLIAQAASVKD